MNTPIVHFPNLVSNVDQVLLDLISVAYHDNRLPPRYRFLHQNLPRDFRPVATTVEEVFNNMKDAADLDTLGEIAGISNKALAKDIARGYFQRAIGCVRRLLDLYTNPKTKAEDLESPRDGEYFVRDLTILTSILNSRKVYVAGPTLKEYLAVLEEMQNASGHNDRVEQMCRKLRAITRPKARPAEPVAAVQTQAPKAKAERLAEVVTKTMDKVQEHEEEVDADVLAFMATLDSAANDSIELPGAAEQKIEGDA